MSREQQRISHFIFFTITLLNMPRMIALAKLTKNVFSEDPNDFVLNSLYNGFKLVVEGTKSITLSASTINQTFSQAHGLGFVPLVDAFAKRNGETQVFKPNGIDVDLWGAKLGMSGDVTFNYVQADITNIYFNFDNIGSAVDVDIRYFCLESIGA